MSSKSIHILLRDIRKQRGESLRSAARGLGIDAGYLSRVERGEKRPSGALQQKVAEYYDLSIDDVGMATGRVPDDVLAILRDHPEAVELLRKRFADPE
jgi:transcriptional regulator with XRE-family HTH domain